MTCSTRSSAPRKQLTRLIAKAVDQGSPSAIEVLLSHPHLQATRRVWVEEPGWWSIPAMVGNRLVAAALSRGD